jgi:hypothetical protein
MNSDELKTKFNTAYKIIARERKMREYVFRHDPLVREAKVAEMDKLLAIVTELKDELKPHCDPGHEQPLLLDAPRKADYQ